MEFGELDIYLQIPKFKKIPKFPKRTSKFPKITPKFNKSCLLYTSDAADE